MPLDSTHAATKTDLISAAFSEIGKAQLPTTKSTKDKLALEYWAASLLNRLSEARREKAKKAAVMGGVLPDHTSNPLAIGSAETVYSGPLVTIGVKVVAQADRVNVPGLVAYLEKNGVKPALLKRAVKRHTEVFGGAHIFTALLTE